jgi:hypothetical protein
MAGRGLKWSPPNIVAGGMNQKGLVVGLSRRATCEKMECMKRVCCLLPLAIALLLQGCASVKSTEMFYTPKTNVFYAPKGKDFIIPVMNEKPGRPYAEIGRFAFQTDLGYPFLYKALEYNARRVGADAILVKESRSWSIPYWYTVPPSLGWVPVGGWYGGGCGGWYGGAAAVPVYYPGYSGVNYRNFTGIDARMIVFKP